jgi:hypothetical protein
MGSKGGRIFQVIDERRKSDHLRFIMLLGDQIYADDAGHNGLGRVACSWNTATSPHLVAPAFRQMLENLLAYMIWTTMK